MPRFRICLTPQQDNRLKMYNLSKRPVNRDNEPGSQYFWHSDPTQQFQLVESGKSTNPLTFRVKNNFRMLHVSDFFFINEIDFVIQSLGCVRVIAKATTVTTTT